jgi:hypothetical protein
MYSNDRGCGNGDWRRLHNEELCGLYCSPSIQAIKSRRMRWAGHVARTEYPEMCIQGLGGGYLRERDHLEDLDLDGIIILKMDY